MTRVPDRGVLAWMAAHPVAANLLFVLLLAGGVIAAVQVKKEVFPAWDLDLVTVTVSYPGATPEEVEEGIVLAVEEAVRPLPQVDRLVAVAGEGRAVITAELRTDSDADVALQEIKNAVDRITTLPEEAERPVIRRPVHRPEVMNLAVTGIDDPGLLYAFAHALRQQILDLPEVSQVEVRGLPAPELEVVVRRDTLWRLGLTLEEVAAAIRAQALDVSAGALEGKGGDVLLRVRGRIATAGDLARLAIRSPAGTSEVLLGDIAAVRDTFAANQREAYYDGRRAALLSIHRVGDETPLAISAAVRRLLADLRPTLPAGVTIALNRDRSDLYRDRLTLLLKNGLLGLVLVLVSLAFFLEARLAFWVAMGIPVSIAGAFLVLGRLDASLNMVSMFAFIVTLGIIVDDAIVIGENIHYHRQQGQAPLAAAITGVRQMAGPVIAAVATNVFAFLPLAFIPGSTGRFFAVLPVVAVAVFLVSLVESLFILPAHLAHTTNAEGSGPAARLARRGDALLAWLVDKVFTPCMTRVLAHRSLALCVAAALLAAAWAYWHAGWIDFSFRPRIETDRVDAEITLPYGTPFAEVRQVARRVEEAGRRAATHLGGDGLISSIMTDVGRRGANTAEVQITLVPSDHRQVTAGAFSRAWRQEVGDLPGLESLFFDFLVGPGGSRSIDVELSHPDTAILEEAAGRLARTLATYEGVADIDDGVARGKPQLDFALTPAGRSLGLDTVGLGRQLRNAFYGAEALRQQGAHDEIKVMVRLPAAQRAATVDLALLPIRTPAGGLTTLDRVARTDRGRSYTEIRRVDGRRVLDVTANLVPGQAGESRTLASLAGDLAQLTSDYPGLRASFAGRERERRQALEGLGRNLFLAAPAIYACLAIVLEGYLLPLAVMAVIPFGLACALAGHILLGYDLSVVSLFGMIALCGVVVNDAMVLMKTARDLHAQGMAPAAAALQAARRRFRPILLTSLTTFCGLAPMIFETSVQARYLVPMAIALGFGILLTTFVTLLLGPVLFVIATGHGNRPPWR